MLEKIYLKQKFFLDVLSETSTTEMTPGRGVYIRITYGPQNHSWTNSFGIEIDHPDWIDYLDNLYDKR